MSSRQIGRQNDARRFLRELRSIGNHIATAAKDAIKRGAEAVATDAKALCPVRTGKLRDSIKAERQAGARYKVSSLWYGRIVEFSPKINKPFLMPALEQNRNGIRADIREAIRQALRRR